MISRQVSRQDRGRPYHTYAITEAGLKALGSDSGEMASVLWREIMRIDSPDVRKKVLTGVKDALVQRFGSRMTNGALPERLKELCSNLTQLGFDVDMETEPGGDGQLGGQLAVLREHNCPYHDIVEEDPSFCHFETSIFSEILQAPVELTTCRLEGHRCCEFQIGVEAN
ncbi:helix-turn-helix transcriptional regulator [Planctomicrobium sp. SH668]|uniref:helix-turn-helix transcriptional regulator n=1 Tax=Planctomicrobium sp. SH668 TaxID=3448126 RepID=UPI003F5AF074